MIPVTRAEARRQWGNLTPFGQLVVQVAATALVSFGLVLVAGTCAPAEGPRPASREHGPIVPPASYVVAETADQDAAREASRLWVVGATPAVPSTEHEEVQHVTRGSGVSDAGVGADRSSAVPTPGPAPSATPHELTRDTRVVTHEEVLAALAETSWPPETHALVAAIVQCESRGDLTAVGDGGLAYGPLQVRVDVHPHIADAYDLQSLHGGLEGGYVVWAERRALGWPGWNAWATCARRAGWSG